MIDKIAAPPASEAKSNEKKHQVDRLAAELLDLDEAVSKMGAKKIEAAIHKQLNTSEEGPPRVVICGAAGSGKSTLAGALSNELGVSTFDLDDYIKGGFSPIKKVYEPAFMAALMAVWIDMPGDKGWILEHVRATDPLVLTLMKPNFAVIVEPGKAHIEHTAQARNMVGSPDPRRLKRAMDTMEEANKQWAAIPFPVCASGKGWRMKRLNG